MSIFLILLVTLGLAVAMLVLIEAGRRLGVRQRQRDAVGSENVHDAVTATEGAMFALLGLLIAFTFAGAASRFQGRHKMIVDEANAMGTAWLRLDLLPATEQPAARDDFRRYVDARLSIYAAMPDEAATRAAVETAAAAQTQLWRRVVAGIGQERVTNLLLVPALNEMFDIGTVRTEAHLLHPPSVIFVLLFTLSLGCSLLAGVSMAGAPRCPLLHQLAFVAVISVTVYVTLDIEYPRNGLIRVVEYDRILTDLRASLR